MAVTRTGNAEIDQQHEILDTMVAQLQTLCRDAGQDREPSCSRCAWERQQQCRGLLAAMVRELAAFLIGHATYEERMMDLLPNTPTCQAHVKAHKAAHEGVSRQLRKLGAQVADDTPLAASAEVWRVIGTWLGDHTSLFDHRLVRMARSASPEMDYDSELVEMLDRHVFPNRPTAPKSKSAAALALQSAKADLRARFESLTPAQRTVFWLVVGGRKNRQIADELGISTNTVKTHRAMIFQKMGASSVVELVKKTDVLR
jgi:DNA-binding CsgD family transcriptional regulator/hemerythrin